MGFGSLWHWVIVLLVVLVLFGRGRVSEIMGDFGKGIKSFKQGLNEDDSKPAAPLATQIPSQPVPPSQPTVNGETVVDTNSTVGAVLKKEGAEVLSFHRLAVGEGIEKKEDDFAGEVMKQAGLA